MGAQPAVLLLIWGVAGWELFCFRGGLGANRRVKLSSHQLGGAELVPERVKSIGGVLLGGHGGTPAMLGGWGR